MKLTTFGNNVATEKKHCITLKRKADINKILFSIFILLLGVILSACVSDSSSNNNSEKSASLSFSAEWVSNKDSIESLDLTNCETISSVNARIFTTDTSDQLLKTGGPWPCSAGQGEMDSVPSGYSAYVTVYGRDVSNQILYIGESESFDLISNETAHAGVVVAQSFNPSLISPADNQVVSGEGFILEWSDPSSHAVAYHLQIATSLEFSGEDIVLDVPTINENRYRPNISDFSTGRSYYWRIFSLEKLGDTSAPSIARSFMIDNGPASVEALFSWETSITEIDRITPAIWNPQNRIIYEHDGPSLQVEDGQSRISSLPGSEPLKSILYGHDLLSPFDYTMRGESVLLPPESIIDFELIEMKNFVPTPLSPQNNTTFDPTQTIVTFEWEKVSSAVAYEIVFLEPGDHPSGYGETPFSITVEDDPEASSTQSYQLTIEPQYSGYNYWSIKAIDAANIKSARVTVMTFYVEPINAPE